RWNVLDDGARRACVRREVRERTARHVVRYCEREARLPRHHVEGDVQGPLEPQADASARRAAYLAGGAGLHRRLQQRPDRSPLGLQEEGSDLRVWPFFFAVVLKLVAPG